MIPKFLVISAFSAGLAALPILASAQTGTTTTVPQTTTGTSPDSMGTSSKMGWMNEGGFNPRNYRSTTDCLNAAAAARVSLSACGNTRRR